MVESLSLSLYTCLLGMSYIFIIKKLQVLRFKGFKRVERPFKRKLMDDICLDPSSVIREFELPVHHPSFSPAKDVGGGRGGVSIAL